MRGFAAPATPLDLSLRVRHPNLIIFIRPQSALTLSHLIHLVALFASSFFSTTTVDFLTKDASFEHFLITFPISPAFGIPSLTIRWSI